MPVRPISLSTLPYSPPQERGILSKITQLFQQILSYLQSAWESLVSFAQRILCPQPTPNLAPLIRHILAQARQQKHPNYEIQVSIPYFFKPREDTMANNVNNTPPSPRSPSDWAIAGDDLMTPTLSKVARTETRALREELRVERAARQALEEKYQSESAARAAAERRAEALHAENQELRRQIESLTQEVQVLAKQVQDLTQQILNPKAQPISTETYAFNCSVLLDYFNPFAYFSKS